ncbi:MAG: glycosyltransferase family 4 protein [Gemmatimonadaceae bacterium]
MKIVLINSLYAPNVVGGAERVVQSLAEELAVAGHEPVMISLSPDRTATVRELNGVKSHYLGLRNVYWPFHDEPRPKLAKPLWHAIDSYNPRMAADVAEIVSAERPDVVHTNNLAGFSPLVWTHVKRQKIPVVHTLHDYSLLCPRATMYNGHSNCVTREWTCALYTWPRARLARSVDAVVGVSAFVLDRHLAHGAFTDVPVRRVIHNGYRSPVHSAPRPDRESSALRIGFMGRLIPTKGIELLLSVLSTMPQNGWELWVAGQGAQEYVAGLQSHYQGVPARYVGFTDPEAFLSQVDVLVVPSIWHEPMGLVVIEALAHGVPVIGSNRGGITELIDHGRTGLLFDPDEASSLRTALDRFMSEPGLASGMRRDCLERAKHFSPVGVMRQHEAVYGTVCQSVASNADTPARSRAATARTP